MAFEVRSRFRHSRRTALTRSWSLLLALAVGFSIALTNGILVWAYHLVDSVWESIVWSLSVGVCAAIGSVASPWVARGLRWVFR